jgi:hypothetical protein
VVTVPGGRIGAAVAVLAAPLVLTACGLVGGSSNHDATPVVIPAASQSGDGGASDLGAVNSGDAGTDSSGAATSSAAAQALPSTATKTALVVRTDVIIRSRTSTKTVIPPAKTVTSTVTTTETTTKRKTVTVTVNGGVVPVPPGV